MHAKRLGGQYRSLQVTKFTSIHEYIIPMHYTVVLDYANDMSTCMNTHSVIIVFKALVDTL
jgi:hypothetical protein